MSKSLEKAIERAKYERDKHKDNPILAKKHNDLVIKLEKKLSDNLKRKRNT